jgi:hypothetical protein
LSENNSKTDFQQYIIKSNNLYHSLLVFLGSYTKDSIIDAGGNITNLLQPLTGVTNRDTSFPIMQIDNTEYQFFGKEKWPQSKDGVSFFGHPASMLSQGVKQNLGLDTDFDNGKNIRKTKYSFSRKLNDSSTSIWAFPEYSYMLLSNRIAYDDLKGNFNKAIRQTSLGGGGVFDVTPVAMAEMYGRLATMNAGYKLTIDEPRSTQNSWNPGENWNGTYESFHYGTLFDAMQKVVTSSEGTAHNLRIKPNYFIYAKTGTIGSENGKLNSKRLAIIISKEPLTSKEKAKKFYVVYFRFDNARLDKEEGGKDFWIFTIYSDIVNQIIESTSFKNYME